jgi:hypothetical protein
MIYVEAPQMLPRTDSQKLFLAGGISGCIDWQKEAIEELRDLDILIINPRRKYFDTSRKDIEMEQIRWEFSALQESDIVLFWFPPQTLCPITLYELGKISCSNKKLFIGVDPDYSRKSDVIIQTGLIRPDVIIVHSIKELVNQTRVYYDNKDFKRS